MTEKPSKLDLTKIVNNKGSSRKGSSSDRKKVKLYEEFSPPSTPLTKVKHPSSPSNSNPTSSKELPNITTTNDNLPESNNNSSSNLHYNVLRTESASSMSSIGSGEINPSNTNITNDDSNDMNLLRFQPRNRRNSTLEALLVSSPRGDFDMKEDESDEGSPVVTPR